MLYFVLESKVRSRVVPWPPNPFLASLPVRTPRRTALKHTVGGKNRKQAKKE